MNRGSVLLAVGATFGVAALVFAGQSVDETVGVPAHITASVTADGCTNNPGPFITVEGELVLSGLNAKLIFRNNEKGTHERTEDVVVDVNLLPEETIKFAKQPPQGGVGGNPWIYGQLCDDAGNPISDRQLLGRCVQGFDVLSLDFVNLTDVAMEVTGDCSNNPGPFITLEGALSFEGITLKLTFQNKRGDAPHVREEAVDVEIVIIPAGDSIKFAKQPPLGGVGGNPRIYLLFCDEDGKPLSKEIFLGKCVQLSK